MSDTQTLKITLVRSAIGGTARQRATLRGLGLMRRGRTVEVADTPEAQGRVRLVAHLIQVEK